MTEPVAYRASERKGDRWLLFNQKPTMNVYEVIEPLYTAEQLQQRVKMTQEQRRQFKNYKTNEDSFYHFWQSVLVDGVSLFKDISERDLMLAWLDEETIEIVPDMKWFVRSKKSDKDGYYWWLIYNSVNFVPEYMAKKNVSSLIKSFDTKEEAEKWTNPLTEAVQLPVEGE